MTRRELEDQPGTHALAGLENLAETEKPEGIKHLVGSVDPSGFYPEVPSMPPIQPLAKLNLSAQF